ncbi:unnamed protein product [Plutella xylostella]|uniref:(diamondback moth) hypothetical protein n=1 Tax=Plutella xylostella TaxID=51655 RepID=A0A8S4ELP3_PLUXY|nr:unnamed protein product [Plutella xylostella]
MWQVLNNISGKIKTSLDNVVIKAFNNDTSLDIANNFAKNFEKNIENVLPNCDNRLLDSRDYETPVNLSMRLKKVTPKDVKKVIVKLKNNKAPGIDNIRTIDIKLFGFLANKSTSSLLSQFTDLVNSHLDNKRHVLVVFIDYSKAFDTLKHETLLKKLDNCGIRGPVLNWCKEYLHDRAYYVKIADTYSSKQKVTVGTAQGSVLGPLHYLTYVNDAPNVVKKCTIFQFADDTCLISAHKDIKTAEQNLQADFTNIYPNPWTLCRESFVLIPI